MSCPAEVVLTKEQQDIVDKFSEFMKSDEEYFVISAPAGTGKTFLCKYLKDKFVCDEYSDFVFTATTNKAAAQLSEATGEEAFTIHSFLNLCVYNDFNTGETYLSTKDKTMNAIHYNKVIVIDECSMIDEDLLRFLKLRCVHCKFIFVGDDRQLTPVNGGLSTIFTLKNINRMETVVRNKDQPELVDICKELRDVVKDTKFKIFKTKNEGIFLFTEDRAEEYKQLIQEKFKKPNTDYKILAYTNKACIEYSKYILKLRNYTQLLNVSEYYTINNPIYITNNIFLPTDVVCQVLDYKEYNHSYNELFPAYKVRCSIFIGEFDILVPKDIVQYNQALARLSKEKKWKDFFYIKEHYADLRMRDVSTVHKAQGSTFKEVFIDLSNLGTCKNSDTFARLLYVAISRAKDKVYLYGKLPEKYGSFV